MTVSTFKFLLELVCAQECINDCNCCDVCSVPVGSLLSASGLPRIYPDMFGYTISELVDDLRGKVYGCPRITKEISGY